MKRAVSIILSLFAAGFFLLSEKSLAATPSWVTFRPVSRDYYIGIGVCSKKEYKDDCRKIAEDQALLELSSAISVDVSGTFVQKAVERTGLSEQHVRQEIRTSTRARLIGHELAGEWEDRKHYWIYYQLSKQQYIRQRRLEKERAVAAAVDMLTRGEAAETSGDPVSALRFYFEALAKVQDFVGENIQATVQNRSIFLFNEIYANIQLIMADVRLKPEKNRVPALIGEPLHDPLTVVTALKHENEEAAAIAGLPIRFDLAGDGDESPRLVLTDGQGLAGTSLDRIKPSDNGRTVRAYVDVDALSPAEDTRGFFRALIAKLTIPETSFTINTFEDREAFHWHREFEGQNILILSAYQTKESIAEWPKMHDEMLKFIKSNGADIEHSSIDLDLQNIIRLSEGLDAAWPADAMPGVDAVIVMAAVGKLNKRENAQNPFGEDVQFAGEIRTSALKSGKLFFSDRYKGATGWNPMGEEMCMDVLALHVMKRWKQQYFKQLKQ